MYLFPFSTLIDASVVPSTLRWLPMSRTLRRGGTLHSYRQECKRIGAYPQEDPMAEQPHDAAHTTSTGIASSTTDWLDAHFEMARPEYEAQLRAVGIQPGWRVLDAACGGGASCRGSPSSSARRATSPRST